MGRNNVQLYLICIALTTSHGDYLLLDLLAIWISSTDSLFVSFPFSTLLVLFPYQVREALCIGNISRGDIFEVTLCTDQKMRNSWPLGSRQREHSALCEPEMGGVGLQRRDPRGEAQASSEREAGARSHSSFRGKEKQCRFLPPRVNELL